MSKNIVITGLGWLGLPLARHLIGKGHLVKGSVTSLKKAAQLQSNGIEAYPLLLSESGIDGNTAVLFKNAEYLIVNIPPGLRKNTGSNYVGKMSHFLAAILKSDISKVILVSSTSVYSDEQGAVTETDLPTPDSEAGKQLLAVEDLFFSSEEINCSIVRFGGLIGGNRQPVRYLAGRTDLNDARAPVNLIHRSDCIGILSEILEQKAFGHIFNAVHPHHPLKNQYYVQKAKALNLEPPQFSESHSEVVYKKVDSENIEKILNYRFQHTL
jgi:nucleoside-diphosphate-sugar epimerase